MLGGLEAALLFVVLVVPGYLAMGGYRLGRASPAHPEGLAAAARAVTVSVIVVMVVWKLGGRSVYDTTRTGTGLTSEESLTYRVGLETLVLPPSAGFLLGELIDFIATKAASMLSRLEERDDEVLSRREVGLRWGLRKIRARLPLDGPSTWDRIWKTLKRDEPFVHVRVMTNARVARPCSALWPKAPGPRCHRSREIFTSNRSCDLSAAHAARSSSHPRERVSGCSSLARRSNS